MRGWLRVQDQPRLHSVSQFNLDHRVVSNTKAATQIRCLDGLDSPILLKRRVIESATEASAMAIHF